LEGFAASKGRVLASIVNVLTPVLLWTVLLGGDSPPESAPSPPQPVEIVDETPVPTEGTQSAVSKATPPASSTTPVLDPVESPTAIQSVEVVEEPTAMIESIELEGHPNQDHVRKKFARIFGPSPLENIIDSGHPEDYVLKPLRPLSVVGVILEPVKEANLLLPKRLDPFTPNTDEVAVPSEDESKQELEKIKQQQKLLDLTISGKFDSNWHFQAAAGGSFKQGNNPGVTVNSQLSAERRTLNAYFLSRLSAYYNQLQGAKPNRRVYGELNYDRNLRGRWITYARQEVEWDQARLINIREVTSLGIGFKFADTVKERLLVRLGPTGSYINYAPPSESQSEARSGWLTEVDYRRIIADMSRLQLTSTAYPDFNTSQSFRIRTEAAVLFPIGRTLAWNWKVGVRHEYIMNPVATTVPNDVEGYFSIAYVK